MNNSLIKNRAIRLRRLGYSYNRISKLTGSSKGTLSYWLKDIPLSEKFKKQFYNARIKNLSLGTQSQKQRRQREIEEIIKEAKKEILLPLDTNTLKLIGAALYWAEGSKTSELAITNSDPYLIFFMIRWFEQIFKIKPKELKAHLNIYSQQNENDLKCFWSELCDIPLERFGKSYIKPTNKNYKKNNLYYGTIKVRVSKSTDLKIKVFAWIQKMLKSFNPKIEYTQKRWQRLKDVKRPVNLL